MIKRNKEYWLKHGTMDEMFEYLQHLIIAESMDPARENSFDNYTEEVRSPKKTGNEIDEKSMDDPKKAGIMRRNSKGDFGIDTADGGFQNLMPIINSSDNQTAYLQYVYSFITNNLTDLSAITSILDISKFVQNKRTPLMSEFSMDSNLLEVVRRVYKFKEDQKRSEKRTNSSGEITDEPSTPKQPTVVMESGEKGVYKAVPQEYFRNNFEPDIKSLLSNKSQIESKLNDVNFASLTL